MVYLSWENMQVLWLISSHSLFGFNLEFGWLSQEVSDWSSHMAETFINTENELEKAPGCLCKPHFCFIFVFPALRLVYCALRSSLVRNTNHSALLGTCSFSSLIPPVKVIVSDNERK